MIGNDHQAAMRLLEVISGVSSHARYLQAQLANLSEAHRRFGQHSVADELEEIGGSIVAMATEVGVAHGELIAEDSRNTVHSIDTLFATVLGAKS